MTSKEALEELECVLATNPGTKMYSDIFKEHLLSPIERDLLVFEELGILRKYYPPFKAFLEEMFEKGHNGDLAHVKEWLENDE